MKTVRHPKQSDRITGRRRRHHPADGPEIWDEHAIETRATWLHAGAVEVRPYADGSEAGPLPG